MKRVPYMSGLRQDPASLERLAAMLNRTTEHTKRPVDAVHWIVSGREGSIRCQFPIGPSPSAKKAACDKVARVLADYTLTDQEPSILRDIFQRKFGMKDELETDAIIAEAVSLLNGEPEPGDSCGGRGRDRRLRKLTLKYAGYLEDNERLNLDGFLRFRLGEYRAEVEEAAEAAMEERMMERQYQEFMTLLKAMVEWQDTRISAVHVMHSGGHAFRLLDEQMRPLEKETEPPEPRGEAEEESLLVSRLLAVSPRQLYIHTPEPESQVIRTLIGIFGERAALCTD
ncbi:putative sporulation protein YtxC [Cohnella faecalis]|nr:putative sporulation protein YtxC [Cohnella faecalis]